MKQPFAPSGVGFDQKALAARQKQAAGRGTSRRRFLAGAFEGIEGVVIDAGLSVGQAAHEVVCCRGSARRTQSFGKERRTERPKCSA